MRALKLMSIMIAAAGFASHAAWAASITETASLTLATTTLESGPNFFDFAPAVAQFNPSLGTLTGVTGDLTGSAIWTSSASFPHLALTFAVVGEGAVAGPSNFNMTGPITVDLSGSADSSSLSNFEGTGTATLVLSPRANDTGDTFATLGSLAGSITYDYTPTVTAVPEPSSLTVFGTGLVGLAFLRRRKRCQHLVGRDADAV